MVIPFKLAPLFKEYVWGGNKLRPQAIRTAEAWIVFEENVVLEGPYSGQTLAKVAELEKAALLGTRVFNQSGVRFPLLIKLLDCAQWVSLQVHPNNEQAEKLAGLNHFGKTEAWYVINAEENAQLISGFKSDVTYEDIQKAVGRKEILDLIEFHLVKTGDTLFISPGTIHALGPGLLIYEVQQNSDITYRVYDWDRPAENGRNLHIDESVCVLNPHSHELINHSDNNIPTSPPKKMVSCEFFTLELLQGQDKTIEINTYGESFAAITALGNPLTIRSSHWNYSLDPLETLFIPADCVSFEVVFSDQARALYSHC